MHDTPDDPFHERGTWSRSALWVVVSLLGHAALAAILISFHEADPPTFQIEFELVEGVELAGLGQSGAEAEHLDAPPVEPLPAEPPSPPEPDPAPPPEPEPEPDPVHHDVVLPPEPPAQPTAEPKPRPRPEPKPEPEPEPEPEPPPAPPEPVVETPRAAYTGEVGFEVRGIPEIQSVAPGNAVMTTMVDLASLRRSQHRASLEALVTAMPDYVRIVGMSKMDPIRDFDHLLITSADLRLLSENLLIADTRMDPPALEAYLAASVDEPLTWAPRSGVRVARPEKIWWAKRGDPRVFALPGKGVVAFAKPELLPYLAARAEEARKTKGSLFPPMPTALAEEGALPAVAVVELSKINVRFGGPAANLPSPIAAQIAIHDDLRPIMRIHLNFKDKAATERFMTEWPKVRDHVSGMLLVALAGYSSLVGRVQHTRDGDTAVYMEVRLEAHEVARGTRMLANLIRSNTQHLAPQPGDLPIPDAGPDAGPDAPDIAADAPALPDVAPDAPDSALTPDVPPDLPPAEPVPAPSGDSPAPGGPPPAPGELSPSPRPLGAAPDPKRLSEALRGFLDTTRPLTLDAGVATDAADAP